MCYNLFMSKNSIKFNNKGLLIGFTNKQLNVIYKIYADFFNKCGIKLEVLKIDEYVLCVENGKTNIDVSGYDFCIQLVKDQYISSLFEKKGKLCFNGYSQMCSSDDKFLTFVKLSENGIPLPKTLSGNTDFDGLKLPDYKRSQQFRDKVEIYLGYPFVAKPTFGYGGKGVAIVKNRKQFDELLDSVGQEPYLFQEFIPDNPGSDIRVMVVGGKVIFTIMRKNPNSFISNVSTGGTAVKYEATKEQKKIATKVAKILGLTHCGVDFFNTLDGRPLVCEVNANAGGIEINETLTGVNQAQKYVEYIINQVYKS